MRRPWIGLVLLLSLGVNLGLLAAIAAGRAADDGGDEEPAPFALPGAGRELPGGVTVELPDEPGGERGVVDPENGGAAAVPPPAAGGIGDRPATRSEIGGGGLRERPAGAFGPRSHRRPAGAPWREGSPGDPPLGRLADHLGLEGERRERFVARQRAFLTAYLENRRQRADLGSELRRELLAPEPDATRIEELLGRLADVHEAGERATVAVILDSRKLLDAEQQRGYFLFLDHLRDGRRPHGSHRGGERHHRLPR